MSDQIQSALFWLSDPRKVALLLSLLLFALALTGCGDVIPACPVGGGSGSSGCGGG
jgi:hypothetical protein